MNGVDKQAVAHSRTGLGWLVAATPLHARTFAAQDGHTTRLLEAAGLPVDASRPDVQVLLDPRDASPASLRTVVWLGITPAASGPWIARRATRVVRAARLCVRVAATTGRLRRRGYRAGRPVTWESGGGAWVDSLSGSRRRHRGVADVLPENVILVADRSECGPSVLEAAFAMAQDAVGRRLEIDRVLIRDTSVVVLDNSAVLRVELGDSGSGVRRQLDAIAWLKRNAAPHQVDLRATRLLAHGDAGSGCWSLEERFSGHSSPAPIRDDVLTDAVDFLAALTASWSGSVDGNAVLDEANFVARMCATGAVDDIRALGVWAQSHLARMTGTVAHGDFFHGNLVVEHDRLVGVVDWERLGTGRPVLHDLVHLRVAERAAVERIPYGEAAVAWVAETASAAERDLFLLDLCGRVGVTPDAMSFAAVATGCWIAHVAHQLARVSGADRAWVAENVEGPASGLRRVVLSS